MRTEVHSNPVSYQIRHTFRTFRVIHDIAEGDGSILPVYLFVLIKVLGKDHLATWQFEGVFWINQLTIGPLIVVRGALNPDIVNAGYALLEGGQTREVFRTTTVAKLRVAPNPGSDFVRGNKAIHEAIGEVIHLTWH